MQNNIKEIKVNSDEVIKQAEYNEVSGQGFCGNKYRISRKDALKEIYCMKKNARKRNE